MCAAELSKVLLLFLAVVSNAPSGHSADVAVWLTKADASVLFQQQNVNLNFQTGSNSNPTITVDETQTFQTMDGFGNALTGGSAIVINSLPANVQDQLLRELFLTDGTNIGVSYLRVSIGASDMSDQHFTYDDMPSGQTDPSMSQFSIRREQRDLIPVLKKIIALNPSIKILGSPWTAPPWMKTNNSYKGGSLKPENYPAYAMYFVKYIQAMKAVGITIDAITPQNEPEYGGNDPSMVMHATEQAEFIKNHLGPAFKNAGITTKILIWDHNCDMPQYPITILNDAQAKQFVDGSAFHLYGGDISAMTQVHNAFPEKNIYFTEKTVFAPSHFGPDLAWAVKNLIIGAPRNWARNVLQWDMATDPSYGPHTGPGGCTNCLGALTIDKGTVTRNVPYYIMAHGSKFARPGSVRIGSNVDNGLQNVAFKTPTGGKVLIVLNDGSGSQTFNIKYNGKMVTTQLDKGSVATYVW